MTRILQRRPSSGETRQRLDELIAARQGYADYLRAVANGQCNDDPIERGQLKLRCDETLLAWRAAHDAWHQGSFRNSDPTGMHRVN